MEHCPRTSIWLSLSPHSGLCLNTIFPKAQKKDYTYTPHHHWKSLVPSHDISSSIALLAIWLIIHWLIDCELSEGWNLCCLHCYIQAYHSAWNNVVAWLTCVEGQGNKSVNVIFPFPWGARGTPIPVLQMSYLRLREDKWPGHVTQTDSPSSSGTGSLCFPETRLKNRHLNECILPLRKKHGSHISPKSPVSTPLH